MSLHYFDSRSHLSFGGKNNQRRVKMHQRINHFKLLHVSRGQCGIGILWLICGAFIGNQSFQINVPSRSLNAGIMCQVTS